MAQSSYRFEMLRSLSSSGPEETWHSSATAAAAVTIPPVLLSSHSPTALKAIEVKSVARLTNKCQCAKHDVVTLYH